MVNSINLQKGNIMKRLYLIILILFCAATANATVYHVDNVNDGTGDTGSEAAPFDTIAACSSAMSASGDDTCFIHAGTYSENVAAKSGLEGHKNTYAAYQNATVIITGTFHLSSKNDVRVIGFEFKNTSTRTMYTDLSVRCEVLYNYFHNTSDAQLRGYSGDSTYLIVRGNRFTMSGCIESETATCVGTLPVRLRGHHILFEYNEIYRPGGDFMDTKIHTSIIRNNYLHDFSFDYFPGNGGSGHPDFLQVYANATYPSYNFFYESNYASDSADPDAHFIQIKLPNDGNIHDLTIRGNISHNIGSYFHAIDGPDYTRMYNNTFADAGTLRSWFGYYYASNNNYNFNNIYYDNNSSLTAPYYIGAAGGTVDGSKNVCFQVGTVTGDADACVSTSDPLFTNYAANAFTLQTDSPAKNTGQYITLANGAGESATALVVDDAEYFTDGFTLTGGDIIKIGANDPVAITAINYDTKTITIATAQTWSDNAEIYWRDQDATPDIGAWEYKASHALTGTWALADGTVTVTPSDASLVRFVEVSENGVPVGTDYSSPYTVSGVGAGLVTVRIFSMHASTTPIVMATQSGDETAPTLAAVTPVSTPSANTTPEYVFSSNEAGTITYGGTCGTGSLSNAINGNNTVTWTLAVGTYSNCTITVNDGANASTPLAVAEFVITGEPVYTLTVNKTGAGCRVVSSPDTSIACGATCAADMGAGSDVQLFGISENGWEPVTFGGDASAGGTVTMSAAKTVTATCLETKLWP